jgi:uncharacterized protein YbaR (Trm112 family)
MFIELVDALRCPNPHEESWLVASADRLEARHIVDGTLGCPVCQASYPVRAGVVDLSGGTHHPPGPLLAASAEEAVRLAALLGLGDASGFAVLMGSWGSHAAELGALVACPLVLIDPPEAVTAGPGLSIVRTNGTVPVAAGAARGVAIDVSDLHGDHGPRVDSAVRATRVKGRVVAPSSLPLPAGLKELARDTELWVAEREPAPSPFVTLHVRRGG